ncbi:MAG: nitroreductase family protein [Promethearchaeota archaeon]
MEEKTIEYLEFIKSRKSIRSFVFKKIPERIIKEILDCGRWAPSGLNNQPWKLCIVAHPTVKRMLAELTKYGGIINAAFVNIIVFLDLQKGYNRIKDIQACGAFMQNILLAINAFPELGGVWLGEILNQKAKVNEIFKLNKEKYELMGVIALGYVDEVAERKKEKKRDRIPLDKFTDWY